MSVEDADSAHLKAAITLACKLAAANASRFALAFDVQRAFSQLSHHGEKHVSKMSLPTIATVTVI